MKKIKEVIQKRKNIQQTASTIIPTRKNVKELKRNYRLKKSELKVAISKRDMERFKELKASLKVDRKLYRIVKKRHKKGTITIYKRTISHLRRQIEKAAYKDDIFAEYLKQQQKAGQRKQIYHNLKKITKGTIQLTGKAIKGTYGLGNRTYNFTKGKGFRNLPNQQITRLRKMKVKLLRMKQHKSIRITRKIGYLFGRGARFANNPLKIMSLVKLSILILPIILLFALFSPTINRPAIMQNDKALTESYLQLTKLDAEHSDTANVFYTSWEDSLFYFNYRYADFKNKGELHDSYKGEKTDKTFDEVSRQWWIDLNGEKGNYKLQDMTDLAKKKSSQWFLKEKSYGDFQAVKNKLRFTTLSGQLKSFLKQERLQITKRFGYERNRDEVILNRMTKVAIPNGKTTITSPMNGKITEVGIGRIVIEQKDRARFTFAGVDAPRLSVGDTVFKGDYLGEATGLEVSISYKKFNGEWYEVNPAFYFPKVEYKQVTLLASKNFSPSGKLKERATQFYDRMTKEGYSVEGIASILGNFEIESQVNPKRAEGDYLAPPIGASVTSWDNPEWLAIGGLKIYGKYPNILRRGLGLGQWTDTADGSVRHTMLLDFAKEKGKNWYDMELQIDFMLNADIPSAKNILKQVLGREVASTVPELTIIFLNQWEGNPNDKVAQRVRSAQNWYQYFTKASTPLSSDSKAIYEQYKDKMLIPYTDKEVGVGQGYAGNAYALGNCTWYVYNRMKQLGKDIHPTMGNANQWSYNYTKTSGARLEHTPKAGDIAVFQNGVYGASATYGHVAVVEAVLEDGSFIISEMNTQGIYSMSYRHLTPASGLVFIRVN